MKFVRIIVAVLILALAFSPALAAACAASCATGEITASASSVTYADSAAMTMAHCHDAVTPQSDKQSGKHQSDTKHKNMVGCHGVQVAPLNSQAQVPAADFTDTLLPPFSPFGVSADLSPPLKPPA